MKPSDLSASAAPMKNDFLDFDDNHTWGPQLTAAVSEPLMRPVADKLVTASPEYVEDARDLLFSYADRAEIINATIAFIKSSAVAGYHGCRLNQSELESIRARGLVPLDAKARRARLSRALSAHPRWDPIARRLEVALHEFGPSGKAGCREGQVHLTLSRCGLVNGFDHYLTHGSEFDQRVADDLLGSDGKELLRNDGRATVIQFAVPGEIALNAVNRYFTVDERLARGEVPGLVDEFLKAWSYGLAYPDFDCGTLKVDCGLVFHSTVPAAWILDVDILSV